MGEMIVLRYAYVLALVVWVGGLIAAGALRGAGAVWRAAGRGRAPPAASLAGAAFGEVLRRVLVGGRSAPAW